MHQCSMTVSIQTDSDHAITAASRLRRISLSYNLFVNFVTNVVCAFPMARNNTGAMEFIRPHTAQFGQ
jgi:hypothetical protein